jgi:hypothetical protein
MTRGQRRALRQCADVPCGIAKTLMLVHGVRSCQGDKLFAPPTVEHQGRR